MEVKPGVESVRHHVQRHSHDIQVPGALSISKQGAFDPVCSSQKAQLGGSDSRSAVIMCVQTDDGVFAMFEMPAEPLDLVCVDIGRGDFDCRWKIEDDFLVRTGFPLLHHGFAYIECIFDFRIGEALW
ncbi:MAG: hypothetical protein BWY82_02342 [Verrucomicrobia bacterium ADurb.Bin474]|nr:MAG: hypothetical protein BWY82_02342 [Verrucomicrobia bacterium ADurb.Bin474]